MFETPSENKKMAVSHIIFSFLIWGYVEIGRQDGLKIRCTLVHTSSSLVTPIRRILDMIKDRKEVREKVIKMEDIVERVYICDVCKKVFAKSTDPDYKRIDYFRIHTCHNDWGNDSVESHTYYDACCRQCTRKIIDDFLKQCEEELHTGNINIDQRAVKHI